MPHLFKLMTLTVFLATLLGACATSRGPEHFYFGSYSEAEELYGKGQYEEAIEKYQIYIDENPEGNLAVISKYYIAKSHAVLGRAEQAKEIYQQIIRDYPDLVWASFSKNQLQEMNIPQGE